MSLQDRRLFEVSGPSRMKRLLLVATPLSYATALVLAQVAAPAVDLTQVAFILAVPVAFIAFLCHCIFVRWHAPVREILHAANLMRRGQRPTLFRIDGRLDEASVLKAVFNDMVTAVDENHRLLSGMTDWDPLTGLLNHRVFREKLHAEVERARTSNAPLALCLVDLDHFHEYNSTSGHAAGDEQLKSYASLLRGASPGNAVIARYAGDQFSVLLPMHDMDAASAIAHTFYELGSKDQVPVSIGISVLGSGVTNDEALVLASELALNRAKHLEGERICKFEGDRSPDSERSGQLQQYLSEGSFATVRALAAAVDAKDLYTKGHSERVATFASDLAQYMNCSPNFVELVYRAGTLHDVGKIGVPDAILSKPTPLTEEEMSVMATHPVLGELIVGKVPQLAELLPGIRNHHERWDGKGYPDGLKAEQIPTVARYLAIADTFDAMTSDRPYRAASPVEVAIAHIERGAGTQFQPELARSFASMVKERVWSAAVGLSEVELHVREEVNVEIADVMADFGRESVRIKVA